MIWQILLWFGVVLLVLVILLVSLPVRIIVHWQSDPAGQATVLLRPFGGAYPPLKVYDSMRPHKPGKPAQKTPKPQTGGRKKGPMPRANMLAEVMALLRRVLGAIHIEALRLDAEFGLGDPAETGQLFGQLCPLIYGSGIYGTGGHVQLRPNFGQACLRGTALAQVRVTPIALAWPFVGFGWRVFGPFR